MRVALPWSRTDSGHQGAVFDASFLKDQEAALNFAHAVRREGDDCRHVIVAGSSTASAPSAPISRAARPGAAKGMGGVARHPEEFDGIVAGAPAMRTGNSDIWSAWANAAFSQIAPKDASGKPEPAKTFSAGERKRLTDAILDGMPGTASGMKNGFRTARRVNSIRPYSPVRGANPTPCRRRSRSMP